MYNENGHMIFQRADGFWYVTDRWARIVGTASTRETAMQISRNEHQIEIAVLASRRYATRLTGSPTAYEPD